MVFPEILRRTAALRRTFTVLAVTALLAGSLQAQSPAPMAAAAKTTIPKATASVTGAALDPDIATDNPLDLSLGRADSFYHGVWLAFMFSVLVGMLWNSRQQNKHLRKLQAQANTLRIETDKARREFARREHLHFENTPLAVVELDAQRRIKEWTGRAEVIFGWRAMEALGKTIEELGWVEAGESSALHTAFATATGAEKAGRIVTMAHRARDGSSRRIEWHISVLPSDNDLAETVLALGLDVTEKEASAAALRREQRHYALVAQAGATGVWTLHPAQGQLTWEPALAEQLEFTPKDFPTRLSAWLELFHPEDRSHFEEAQAAAMREPGVPHMAEVRDRKSVV